MKQIYIFGDSILKGVTYNEEAGRHKLLPGRFANLTHMGYEIQNCSVMGATIAEGVAQFGRKLSAMEKLPEDTAVLLEFGGNDCDYRWADISADPQGAHLPKTPLDDFIRCYGELVKCIREKGGKVYICNLVPLDAQKYMQWISRGLDYDRILTWLGDSSMLYRWHEFYSRATEQLAARLACPLIDLRMPFLMRHDYQNLLSGDGIHPTAEGHTLVDTTIAAAIG